MSASGISARKAGPPLGASSVRRTLQRSAAAIASIDPSSVERVGDLIVSAYHRRRRVFILGNGGSAATASHLACDLANNAVEAPRRRVDAVCLSDSAPTLTSIANDSCFDRVFADQLRGIGCIGDVLIAISVSGDSPNVLAAMEYARACELHVAALLGRGGGATRYATALVVVDGCDYGPVEDAHAVVAHALTAYVRAELT